MKNSGAVKPYQLLDVATQAWVVQGSGVNVSLMIVRHLERPMMHNLVLRPWIRFVDGNVTAELLRLLPLRRQVIERARQAATGTEPDVQPGRHWTRPFRCEFREHCGGPPART